MILVYLIIIIKRKQKLRGVDRNIDRKNIKTHTYCTLYCVICNGWIAPPKSWLKKPTALEVVYFSRILKMYH